MKEIVFNTSTEARSIGVFEIPLIKYKSKYIMGIKEKLDKTDLTYSPSVLIEIRWKTRNF